MSGFHEEPGSKRLGKRLSITKLHDSLDDRWEGCMTCMRETAHSVFPITYQAIEAVNSVRSIMNLIASYRSDVRLLMTLRRVLPLVHGTNIYRKALPSLSRLCNCWKRHGVEPLTGPSDREPADRFWLSLIPAFAMIHDDFCIRVWTFEQDSKVPEGFRIGIFRGVELKVATMRTAGRTIAFEAEWCPSLPRFRHTHSTAFPLQKQKANTPSAPTSSRYLLG